MYRLGPEDVSLLERCPHFRGWYVQASMELGPEDVSLLEKYPHFRGQNYNNICTSFQSPPVVAPARRSDAVHTRKSIEGLNQEITSVLEGVQILSPVSTLFSNHTFGRVNCVSCVSWMFNCANCVTCVSYCVTCVSCVSWMFNCANCVSCVSCVS